MSDNKTAELVEVKVLTPMEQITLGIEKGVDLDKLKQLLELQKEYEANEAYKAFNKAMADFKSEAIKITKDKAASFETQRGKTEYAYASLANIIIITTPTLAKCALAATWKTKQENDKIYVTCRVTHSLGHFEDVTLSASADSTGSKNAIQAMGSTITYLEKYTYLAALGLATSDQDDDAKTSEEIKFITAWEAEEILKALKEKNLDSKYLCKYLGTEKIEEIKAAEYHKAMNAIKAAPKKEVAQ